MPVTILSPSADGSETAWSLLAGATKWQAVLAPDDGDATAIQQDHHTGTSRQSFVMDDLPMGAVGVKSHTIRTRARRSTTVSPPSKYHAFIKLSSSYSDPAIGGPYWNIRPETYYQDLLTPNLAKPGGGLMDVSDINSAEIGVRLAGVDAAENVIVTTIEWSVEWGVVKGDGGVNFAIFVGSLVGPIIGAAVLLGEIPRLARCVAARTAGRHRILPCEYVDLWRSLRAPRRVYA